MRPEDPDYDEVRKIWNAMIDRRPAVIVQCADAADVQRSIAFASENRLELTIRGAGHNIAGNAVCENGLMIDLSTLKGVTVDPNKRRPLLIPGRRSVTSMRPLRHTDSQLLWVSTPQRGSPGSRWGEDSAGSRAFMG